MTVKLTGGNYACKGLGHSVWHVILAAVISNNKNNKGFGVDCYFSVSCFVCVCVLNGSVWGGHISFRYTI